MLFSLILVQPPKSLLPLLVGVLDYLRKGFVLIRSEVNQIIVQSEGWGCFDSLFVELPQFGVEVPGDDLRNVGQMLVLLQDKAGDLVLLLLHFYYIIRVTLRLYAISSS